MWGNILNWKIMTQNCIYNITLLLVIMHENTCKKGKRVILKAQTMVGWWEIMFVYVFLYI